MKASNQSNCPLGFNHGKLISDYLRDIRFPDIGHRLPQNGDHRETNGVIFIYYNGWRRLK